MKQKKDHIYFEELLMLSFYDELDEQGKSELTHHIEQCGICRHERAELQSLHAVLGRHGRLSAPEPLLAEARNELREKFLRQEPRKSIGDWLNELPGIFLTPAWRFAFVGVLCLGLGFGGGYLYLRSAQNAITASAGVETVRTENIAVTSVDPATGEVELSFETVRPVHLKTRIDDQRVVALMAKALTDDRNPGVRLRAVSFIARQDDALQSKSPVTKKALIAAATGDENPAVRKEALLALSSFPFDQEIQSVMLAVLAHDENAGLRIAAIDALQLTKFEARLKDGNVQSALRSCIAKEKNTYVRQQAKLFIQEAVNL